MQLIHSNTLDALRRVQGFLDSQAAALGSAITATLRARLDAAATQLDAFKVAQGTAIDAARGETTNQAGIRKDIRVKFMEPIARVAKASLKTVGEYPTLVAPSSTLRQGDFLGAVQMLADAAAKNEKTFVDHGMPPDFLAQLRADITLLTTSKAAQAQAVTQRATATSGIKDTDKVAHEVLVLLNSSIAPVLKNNAPLLAGWKAAKKISVSTPLPAQPTGVAPASSPAPATPAAPVTPVAPATTSSAGPATPTSSTPGTAAAVAPAVETAKPAA